MTPRQQQLAAIQKNTKVVDTKPEVEMKGILEEMLIRYEHDQRLKVRDYDGDVWFLQLDFVLMPDRQHTIVLNVNGHHHMTKTRRQNDNWRSLLILEKGSEQGLYVTKVINFDAGFLEKKEYRRHAIKELGMALASHKPVVWSDA